MPTAPTNLWPTSKRATDHFYFRRVDSMRTSTLSTRCEQRARRKCIHTSVMDLTVFRHLTLHLYTLPRFLCVSIIQWYIAESSIGSSQLIPIGSVTIVFMLRLKSSEKKPNWNHFPHSEQQLITICSNAGTNEIPNVEHVWHEFSLSCFNENGDGFCRMPHACTFCGLSSFWY